MEETFLKPFQVLDGVFLKKNNYCLKQNVHLSVASYSLHQKHFNEHIIIKSATNT